MKRLISVSRRTDVPAFYGDWFMRRLKEGFAGVMNPFSGQKYIVSLKPEDVVCFVFWSKDFTPFLENLKIIDSLGYNFYFNYTVTGLPKVFESNVDKQTAIETLKRLSRMYSPRHINWRFDPIIIWDSVSRPFGKAPVFSNISSWDFYTKAFEELVSEFEGIVERCYISFVTGYNKVIRNFGKFERAHNIRIIDGSIDFKIELASKLAEIAGEYGIEVFSCCGRYLVNERIKKAHCVDGSIVEGLFFPEGLSYREKPTRQECGCTESTDIGTYDTCGHGCVYCYANAEKAQAIAAEARHEAESAFLGHSKSESDRWIAEIQTCKTKRNYKQSQMWGQ